MPTLTFIAPWAARDCLPLPEIWRHPSWWPGTLLPPGTARGAGPDLWHRAHYVAAASVALAVPQAYLAPSSGLFSQVDPRGAVATAVHTYGGCRDDTRGLFCTWVILHVGYSCDCFLSAVLSLTGEYLWVTHVQTSLTSTQAVHYARTFTYMCFRCFSHLCTQIFVI